ncbi:hypothetical protein NUU61_000011 [Penicillium alfredii]|uniref:Zn(2)-C6 fungal-type domain-containing protein n=1 Tax=Penicillium alfredii TaxID=1506179 RepID=A0A9W9G945_9EURO|nr:uncharacterized protein NUU61_000011 [Penicillium alfredii]KAJ5114252.1 hypothetical protein NUU61_000011 [Penicillium alfredii]
MDHQPRDTRKRRKIAVACDDCRARKVRCDGMQPGRWLFVKGSFGMRPVLTWRQSVDHAPEEPSAPSASTQVTWKKNELRRQPAQTTRKPERPGKDAGIIGSACSCIFRPEVVPSDNSISASLWNRRQRAYNPSLLPNMHKVSEDSAESPWLGAALMGSMR